MGRKQTGGNKSAVKDIMVNNLCRETKDGQTLKTKDSNSFVQIQNLCSTAKETSFVEETNNNSRSNIVNNSVDQNNQTTVKTNNSVFSGGNLFGNMGSMMFFPMKKVAQVLGVDTDKITESAKNKVNSMLNSNVEQKVQEDKGNTAVVNTGNIDEKIVKKLDNLSGGRRKKTKKNGKKKGKSKSKGRAKNSRKQRR
jgi:hypothetical protein